MTFTWNLKLKFQSKLELRCENHAILNATSLQIDKLLPKFGVDIQSLTKDIVRKPKKKYGHQAVIWKVALLKIN